MRHPYRPYLERAPYKGTLPHRAVTPWGFIAALIGLVGGVIALLLYIIAAAFMLGAIIWLAAKVYKWLERNFG